MIFIDEICIISSRGIVNAIILVKIQVFVVFSSFRVFSEFLIRVIKTGLEVLGWFVRKVAVENVKVVCSVLNSDSIRCVVL